MAIAGVDIGTSGCKVVLFDSRGHILETIHHKYTEYRETGIREIDPRDVSRHLMDALIQIIQSSVEPLQAICITSLGESVVCLDENDQILCNSMVTGDCRGTEQLPYILKCIPAGNITCITGLEPSEMYTLPKLIWLRQHTDILQKTRKIFFYEDYFNYLLTGERKVSYSSASRSMAFDIYRKCWNPSLLDLAGLTPEFFSYPVAPGTVIGTISASMKQRLGLSYDVPVVAGGHDQCCAAIGTGLTDPTTGEDGHGTCEFLSVMLPGNPDKITQLGFPCSPYIFPDSYFTGLEITTCGAMMNWARDTIFSGIYQNCQLDSGAFFRHMDQLAANIRTGILALPQFGSSGNPDINYNVSGTISGLTLHTRPEEIYLGIKESLAFQMKMAYDYAQTAGLQMQKMILTGGGASSPLTAAVRANVFQLPVYLPECKEAGAMGCMILAAVAIGLYPDISTCVSEVVHLSETASPDPSRAAEYQEKYEKYCCLYEKMHAF